MRSACTYHLITPGGSSFDRDDYLGRIAAGTLCHVGWDAGPMEVRQSASMALVRYQARLAFSSGPVIRCWHTDSYERRGERWQAVWSQATSLPASSETQLS